ncbi:MAG: tetratricopeptide repeat protein [Cyanobacteria bacterium P01_F01_bin.150]
MSDPKTELLLEDLKQADAAVRDTATQTLWQNWFRQKGEWGLTLLQQSQLAVNSGELDRAELILNDVIRSQPDFAEAWNRRAVLYYLQGRYTAAISDCQHVLDIVPFHFGALHGLGLCHAALKNYRSAIYAFRRALEIQPYAVANQKFLLECTMQLESSDRSDLES